MSDNLAFIVAATGLAAALGAVVRYLVCGYLNRDFPLGTLAINLTASFGLGIVVAAPDPTPTIVGIGALATLSTWAGPANEAATLSRARQGRLALAYLGLTVSSGVLAAWFGIRVGSLLW